MALRASQAYVSVLGKAPGELRISQVYLAVLLQRNVFNKQLDQELEFLQDFSYSIEGGGVEFEQGFEDNLVFTQEYTIAPRALGIEDIINFSDAFSVVDPNIPQDFEHTLVFNQQFSAYIPATIELTITQVMRFFNPLINGFEGLDDEFSHSISDVNLGWSDILSFAQFMGPTFELTLTQEMELSDSFIMPNTDTLEFEEAWTAIKTLQIEQTLALTDSFPLIHDAVADFDDTLNLTQVFRAVTTESDCTYNLPDPPELEHAILTLQFEDTTLVLRNPEWNDTYTRSFARVQRDTRGGKLIIYADADWTKTKRLKYRIRALPSADAVLDFLQLSLGQLITLTDHYNRTWQGVILNPNTAVIQNRFCDAEFELEFEGDLV